MAGRRAQPIAVIKANGRKHLTKAEIEYREKAEIKFGSKDFKCPPFVKEDVVAFKKWKEIIKDYKEAAANGIEIARSPDVGLIARYCQTYSAYVTLLKHRDRLVNIEFTLEENLLLQKMLEGQMGAKAVDNLIKKIEYLVSIEGLMALENSINKKMDALVKMEDRLFLNPLSKVKNIPKSPPKTKDDPNAELFGD